MSFDLARDFSLFVWLLTALAASVATGSMVGIIVSTPLRTYQLVVWVFLGASLTWFCMAFVGGAVSRFLLESFLLSQYLLFGLLAGLLTLASSYILVRLQQAHRALRWSLLGALSAWLTVAVGSAIAYDKLTTALSDLPPMFWGSLMLSMSFSTVLGAFLGGMIFRHRQAWR